MAVSIAEQLAGWGARLKTEHRTFSVPPRHPGNGRTLSGDPP